MSHRKSAQALYSAFQDMDYGFSLAAHTHLQQNKIGHTHAHTCLHTYGYTRAHTRAHTHIHTIYRYILNSLLIKGQTVSCLSRRNREEDIEIKRD